MTDTPIPDDVLRAAKEALGEAWTSELGGTRGWLLRRDAIARAILADREAQAKRVEELERALRPFTVFCLHIQDDFPDSWSLDIRKPGSIEHAGELRVGHFRAARALFAKEGSDA
jgi:hypothetical protein